ncbi:MAG: hypothetical protein M3O50_06610 [Myxococcota bacterium]|nr:hypothetical protein [Myxococcota bacterium]
MPLRRLGMVVRLASDAKGHNQCALFSDGRVLCSQEYRVCPTFAESERTTRSSAFPSIVLPIARRASRHRRGSEYLRGKGICPTEVHHKHEIAALTALGNAGDPQTLDPIRRYVVNDSSPVRAAKAQALRRIPGLHEVGHKNW